MRALPLSTMPNPPDDLTGFAEALIHSRQHVAPKRLVAPGPSPEQQQRLFEAAAAAPDHGQIRPWRFVIVPPAARQRLADVFALALADRDPNATPEQIDQARDKAHRAPLLMLAIARLGTTEPDIRPLERLVSLGAAIQNLLLYANSLGYGTGLTSGQALESARLRTLFALGTGEEPVCFVNVGTVAKHKPPRLRPTPAMFVSELAPAADDSAAPA